MLLRYFRVLLARQVQRPPPFQSDTACARACRPPTQHKWKRSFFLYGTRKRSLHSKSTATDLAGRRDLQRPPKPRRRASKQTMPNATFRALTFEFIGLRGFSRRSGG